MRFVSFVRTDDSLNEHTLGRYSMVRHSPDPEILYERHLVPGQNAQEIESRIGA